MHREQLKSSHFPAFDMSPKATAAAEPHAAVFRCHPLQLDPDLSRDGAAQPAPDRHL